MSFIVCMKLQRVANAGQESEANDDRVSHPMKAP